MFFLTCFFMESTLRPPVVSFFLNVWPQRGWLESRWQAPRTFKALTKGRRKLVSSPSDAGGVFRIMRRRCLWHHGRTVLPLCGEKQIFPWRTGFYRMPLIADFPGWVHLGCHRSAVTSIDACVLFLQAAPATAFRLLLLGAKTHGSKFTRHFLYSDSLVTYHIHWLLHLFLCFYPAALKKLSMSLISQTY